MVVQRVKLFIEQLLALETEIPLAPIRSFSVFICAGMTSEPTFHRSCLRIDCLRIDVSPFYLTHHTLMHYRLAYGREILQQQRCKSLIQKIWHNCAFSQSSNLSVSAVSPTIGAIAAHFRSNPYAPKESASAQAIQGNVPIRQTKIMIPIAVRTTATICVRLS
jgi:hypothetical protein